MVLAAGALKADDGKTWPCKADAEKFCKDVKPGGGRIIDCLKQHQADLSAECKAKGLEAKEKAGAFMEACKADMDKLCPDVKGGPGEKLRCLKEHDKDLSEACKAGKDKMKGPGGRKEHPGAVRGSDAPPPDKAGPGDGDKGENPEPPAKPEAN
jgi:hypothetical protein